ncbi:BglG family transcription antiterminator [Anaerofustis stercorihominis]|uniref:PRD domain-containing protein n=1 Tax=Anaerofustis stercorihominis TaxID=214853 RepID=A0A3E3DZ58_9FIRM|nr:PTS sugar transporter subunit IIA [Anaerofustis stercorihominis]RGD74570.1 PRD domain-containing protein [Anaerofustis stercorihominis]
MNMRTYQVLKYLSDNNLTSYTVKDLSLKFEVSDRMVRNYLSYIEDFLIENNMQDLLYRNGDKISFAGTKEQGEELLNIIINGGFYEYKLTSKERQFIIKLLLFINNNHLTLSDFEKILFTSKVTVYKDLKKVSDELEKNDIKLNENKRFGFLLDMDEHIKRNEIYKLIKTLNISSKEFLEYDTHNICIWFIHNKLNLNIYKNKVKTALSITEQHYKLLMTENDFYDVTLLLCIILSRTDNKHYVKTKKKNINEKYIQISKHLLLLLYGDTIKEEYINEEVCFLSDYLMKKSSLKTEGKDTNQKINFYIIVKSFLYRLTCEYDINFLNDYKLQEFLTAHIISLYNRQKNNEKILNPYKEDLLKNYKKDYEIISENIYILEEDLGIKLDDNEMTYILMHIVAALERMKQNIDELRVLVMCHAGIGTSQFLAEKLKNQFKIKIEDVVSSHYVKSRLFIKPEEFSQKYDLIITTTPLMGAPIPWIEVNPILTNEDVDKINKTLNEVSRNLPIKEETTIKNKTPLTSVKEKKTNENSKILFSTLLKKENILLDKDVEDWKSSIIIAGEPLLWEKKITADYLRAMVNNALDNGPYFVFAPGIALAHANPKYGVIELGGSFLRLKEPVHFGHKKNDPVKFVIALSVLEGKDNLDMIFKLMNTLCSKKAFEELVNAKDYMEIIDIFKKFEKQ